MNFDNRWETDIYAHKMQVNKYPYDSVVASVFKHFGSVVERAKINILEVGCGTANNISFLAEEGYRAVGIEGSQSAVNFGKKILEQKNLKAELHCHDFTDLSSFDNESFDMVIDRGSITHNHKDAILQAIGEVHRVLKSGGIFLSHIFSKAHSGMKYGNRNSDGSYEGFNDGQFKGYEFVFYFLDEMQVDEIYGKNFEFISKVHNVQQECLNNDDFRAMWYLECKKNDLH